MPSSSVVHDVVRVALGLLVLCACGGELGAADAGSTHGSSDGALADVALPTPIPPDGGAYMCGSGPNLCTCNTTFVHDGGGVCSPQSLGGAAHCCARMDDAGVSFNCTCQLDRGCVEENDPSGACYCGKPFSPPAHSVTRCQPRTPTERCCKIPSEGRCVCGQATCDPTGKASYEVSECTPSDGALDCVGAGATEVRACR